MPRRYLYLFAGVALAYLIMSSKQARTPKNLPETVDTDSGWWPSWLTW